MQRGRVLVRLLSPQLRAVKSSFGLLQHPRFLCLSARIQSAKMSYGIIERGQLNTLDYRVFFTGPKGGVISPFHDIPLFANAEKTIYNMVVEVPRWTNAKMEIATKEKMNPIKQDVKKEKLRFVANIFPHHGYIWNYGCMPQTWEDPNHLDKSTNAKGDNDPIDVCEIGYKVQKRGAVVQVKVLGVMALIDEGETDWKVIAIDVTDPLAPELNDIQDVERHMPGFLKATNEWFRLYKIPDGKPENKFAFNGEAKDRKFTVDIIEQTHKQWQQLVGKGVENNGLACENVGVAGSPYLIPQDDGKQCMEQGAAPNANPASLPPGVDKWHYVSV